MARENLPESARMIVDMDSITNIKTIAVEFGLYIGKNIGDLMRNKLLHVLIKSIAVRAVRNGN